MATSYAPLSMAQIDEIARVWGETRSIHATANATGHERETVRRYVDEGDPARGVVAIRARVAAQRDSPAAIARADKETLDTIALFKRLFGVKLGALATRVQATQRALDKDPTDADAIKAHAAAMREVSALRAQDFVRMVMAEQLITGKPTVRVEGGVDVTDATRNAKSSLLKEQLVALGVIATHDVPAIEVRPAPPAAPAAPTPTKDE